MNNNKDLEAWKMFLKGRILQEQGNEKDALKYIDEALSLDPKNSHFLNAKAFALSKIQRSDEAVVSIVQSEYSKLSTKYVDKNDKPEQWIEGLQKISSIISDFEGKSIEAVNVCW